MNTTATYRPMSNLYILSNNAGKGEHLSREGHFLSHQSAYIKHHSTETLLSLVCSDIITRLDKGDFAMMAFLFLSAAFNVVDKSF